MSIQGAFNAALTSLSTQQAQIGNISNNIANVNTSGYSKQVLNQTSLVYGGVGQGVSAGTVKRATDAALSAASNQANSAQSYSQQMTTVLAGYSAALSQSGTVATDGTTDTTNNVLTAAMSGLQTALTSLSATPGDTSTQTSAVSAAGTLVDAFHTLDSAVATGRQTADAGINSDVQNVNTSLGQIASNEAAIRKAAALGQSTAALEDQRDQLVSGLSQYLPVKVLPNNGSITIATDGGTTLYDGGVVHPLSFTPTTNIPDEMRVTGNAAQGTISGLSSVTVNGAAIKISQNGTIAANLTLRDTTLPQFSGQLDELASNVIGAFQTADTTVTAGTTGLFTTSGSPTTSTTTTPGLARTIGLNSAVDPDQGGQVWRIQSGAQATAKGQSGDATIVNAFLGGMSTAQTYSAATGLPSTDMTTATAQIGGSQQTAYATWSSRNDARTSQATSAQSALSNSTGVNMDQELQRLQLVQQTYAASSQVIQAASQMLNTINGMVGAAL